MFPEFDGKDSIKMPLKHIKEEENSVDEKPILQKVNLTKILISKNIYLKY